MHNRARTPSARLDAWRDGSGRLVDMRVSDCNTHAASMLGLQRAELLDRKLCDVAPSMAAFLHHFDTAIRSQRRTEAELPATEPHLADRWLHHQVVPLEDGVALITRDVTGARASADALASLARSDALTGLANRRHVEEELDAARARAVRSKEPLALLYLDLDGFKTINDTLGHSAGDRVLVNVAARLRSKVRETDLVGRLGGDEFVVIAERAGTLHDIEELCGRILRSLQEPHPVMEHQCLAAPSIGVAIFDGAEPASALGERADEAMYRAKASGKSRYVIATVTSAPVAERASG